MFYEYGEIDCALIADVASIYFPDKDIDADTVSFSCGHLPKKSLINNQHHHLFIIGPILGVKSNAWNPNVVEMGWGVELYP